MRPNNQALQITHCEYLEGQQAFAEWLRNAVASLDLKGMPCNAVLAPEDYAVLFTEAPQVADDELRDAMRWRIKDLSPVPVDQAVLDVFRLPEDAGNVGRNRVFTVVARQQAVEELVALIDSAGLKINAVDVPELCLRNLAAHCAQASRSVMLVRLQGDKSLVTAVCNGNVYLNRQFHFYYNGQTIAAVDADSLALELQRSVDYLQHQLRQPPPSHIFLLAEGLRHNDIPASLHESFSAVVSPLNIADLLATPAGVDNLTLEKCVLAVGAALRDSNAQGKAL